tara:strand:- start:748 stop:1689 length:942 start_codon:yes stop_codon:yes gene_type:complete
MGMRMGRKVKTEQKEKEESKAQEETANYQRFEDLMANMPFGSAASSAVRLGPAAAAMRQAQLRGPEVISPEELKGYRPGIDPEIMYFREKTKETEPYDPDAGPRFDPGDVPDDFFENLRFGLGELAGRGILTDGMLDQFQADLTTEGVEQFISRDPAARTTDYTDIYDFEARPMAAGGSTSVDPLINQTIMAVLGRLPEEDAEVVISRFIDEYGTEAFQMLRNQALRSVVPGAQTEGLIEGEGGGMDDQVPGMIGDQQRVAVSPGEYIIPADVVSATGDGSTDAGAERFDQMIDAIRMEKTGTMEQPEPLGAR